MRPVTQHFHWVADPVPTEANGNLSNSLKHILGHVFLKSEPDPFTKVSVLFFSEEASKIGLYNCAHHVLC